MGGKQHVRSKITEAKVEKEPREFLSLSYCKSRTNAKMSSLFSLETIFEKSRLIFHDNSGIFSQPKVGSFHLFQK